MVKIIKPKVVVILGPTASGKTALGVRLAFKLKGEIISADSRQIYRGMDIGTGKDLLEYKIGKKNIPYHLIDIISPKTKFNVARYHKLAHHAIYEVLKKEKLPLVVGGSGLYLQAIVDNYLLSIVKEDPAKRKARESQDIEQLFLELTKLKPEFAAKLNNSDKHNKRRLIRYLEIIDNDYDFKASKKESLFDFLVLGIDIDDKSMREKIEKRLDDRLEEGLIEEVKRLKSEGVPYSRLLSFGLEYKFVTMFLKGELDKNQLREKLITAIYRFAKRQKTWFKRWEKQGRKIIWVSNLKEAEMAIKKFLVS